MHCNIESPQVLQPKAQSDQSGTPTHKPHQTTVNLQSQAAPGRRPRAGGRDEMLGAGLRLSGAHGADEKGPPRPGGTFESAGVLKLLHESWACRV